MSVQGTCYSAAVLSRFDFSVAVNGTQSGSALRLYFNELNSHRAFAGSWIVTIPAGTNVLTVNGTKGEGTGPISFDPASDFINLTFKG